MDFDLSWLLLGLPITFVLGWFASRVDLRQLRYDNRQAPKAYFKGLNYLLNEQQDQAIDAFIEAVQNDPDTSELHFALGNLFRRRGEYDRAVRVHEHLLSRGDLARSDRERAQHALALDFLKAGLLDRAEQALQRLEATPFEAEARLALLAIYERSNDWSQAAAIADKMAHAGQGDFSTRQAHYLSEQAAAQRAAGQPEAAQRLLGKAIATAPSAARARLDLAVLQQDSGHQQAAYQSLRQLAEVAPNALPLAAARLAQAAQATGQQQQALQLLESSYAASASLDLLDAIVSMRQPEQGAQARQAYALHLQREPSLVAATKWLAGEKLEQEALHPQVQRALEHAARPLTRYRCAACGFEAQQHFWHCPGCQSWDSYPARRIEEL